MSARSTYFWHPLDASERAEVERSSDPLPLPGDAPRAGQPFAATKRRATPEAGMTRREKRMVYEVDGCELRPVPTRVSAVETLYESPDVDVLAAGILRDPGFLFAVLSRRTSWRRPVVRRWRS